MKTIINIMGFFVCVGLVFSFGYACGMQARRFPDPFKQLTLLEAEEKFNCEILHPTIRERQEHINRYGGPNGQFVIVDGLDGPNTKEAADRLRCQQEASKWDFMYEGDSK